MASKTVNTLNTISGRVGHVPSAYLDDPDFSKYLVKVPEGTKDYDPDFWKPTTASEHRAKDTTKKKDAREFEKLGADKKDAADPAPDMTSES